MHMTFWWDIVVKDFLFHGYNINTLGGLISTCCGLIALAIIFEWLKLLQARQRQKELLMRAQQIRTICPPTESATLLVDTNIPMIQIVNITLWDRVTICLWDGLVWFNLQILGYILMLAVMAYNGWMTVALVLGSGLGYFLFGPSFMKINLQNCQTIRDTFCKIGNCEEPEQDGETTPALQASSSTASIPQINNQTSVCIHKTPEEIS